MSHLLGIEIGGTKLQLVAATDSLQITHHKRLTVTQSEGAQGILRQINEVLTEEWKDLSFSAAGVGFGGPVNWQTGQIARSHQIEGWAEVDLGNWLSQHIKAPVWVDNDANLAALAEAIAGAGRGKNPVFYCTLGSGVGGGFVINQAIYHGIIPGEVEFGHLRLDRAGTTLESVCAGWAVDKRIRQVAQSNPNSILAKRVATQTGPLAQQLIPAIEQGDEFALQILHETCDSLAFGLSHVIHLFHPEIIIIGGGLSLMGEPFRVLIEQNVTQYLMKAFLPAPSIQIATLGENVVPIGALLLCRQKIRDSIPTHF
ncbi:MAG: ROK family protein [Spirosomataceae bacterium]